MNTTTPNVTSVLRKNIGTGMVLWILAWALLPAGPAAAQRNGLEQMLIRAPGVVFQPALSPLQMARMLEIPTRARRLGLPSLRFSFGEFLLMAPGAYPGTNPGDKNVYSLPSDQNHASTNPAGLDWSDFVNCLSLMTPVKDQGQRGTCHAEAATSLMEALLKNRSMAFGEAVTLGWNVFHIVEEEDLSVEWLEFAAKKQACGAANAKCGDGGDPAYDLGVVQSQGHIPEVFWPYNPQHWFNDPAHASMVVGDTGDGPWNWKVVAQTEDGNPPRSVQFAIGARNSDPAGLHSFKVSNIKNNANHDNGVNYIKSQLNSGLPVAISIPWPTSRMVANGCVLYVPDSVSSKSESDLWNDKESSGGKMVSKWFEGGHCILVMGMGKPGTPAAGLYAFKNSWSRWWGKNGYGFVSEVYLRKFLGQTVFCDVSAS
jgi:hypothetical protein